MQPDGPGIEEVVGDNGYHSNETLADVKALGLRSYLSEPDRGRRCWKGQPTARDAVHANRRRIRGVRGRRLLRCRGELLERPFAHCVRNRWDAAGSPSRASKHPETAARACRRLQLGAADAAPDRRRHAAQPSGPARGPISSRVRTIARPVGRSEAFLGALHADFVVDDLSTAR